MDYSIMLFWPGVYSKCTMPIEVYDEKPAPSSECHFEERYRNPESLCLTLDAVCACFLFVSSL